MGVKTPTGSDHAFAISMGVSASEAVTWTGSLNLRTERVVPSAFAWLLEHMFAECQNLCLWMAKSSWWHSSLQNLLTENDVDASDNNVHAARHFQNTVAHFSGCRFDSIDFHLASPQSVQFLWVHLVRLEFLVSAESTLKWISIFLLNFQSQWKALSNEFQLSSSACWCPSFHHLFNLWMLKQHHWLSRLQGWSLCGTFFTQCNIHQLHQSQKQLTIPCKWDDVKKVNVTATFDCGVRHILKQHHLLCLLFVAKLNRSWLSRKVASACFQHMRLLHPDPLPTKMS